MLATELKVQSHQKHGQSILERYEAVQYLYPEWEKACLLRMREILRILISRGNK